MMPVHAVAKVPEDARRARNGVIVQHSVGKSIVAQADGRSLVLKNLYVLRRSGPGDDQADRIRSRVHRGQLDGSGHLAPEVGQGVRRLVLRPRDTQVRRNPLAQHAVHLGDASFAV